MNLEDDLRKALRREPAPADFAVRVLGKTRAVPFWRRPAALAIAAALILAALIPPYRQHQRAVEARDQLMAALSITRVQLQQVQEKIRWNTRHKL